MATKKELITLNKQLVSLLRKILREEDNMAENLQNEIDEKIIKSEEATNG